MKKPGIAPILRPLTKAATTERRQTAVSEERRVFAEIVARFPSQAAAAEVLGVSRNSIQRWTTTNEEQAREVPAWAMRALSDAAEALGFQRIEDGRR